MRWGGVCAVLVTAAAVSGVAQAAEPRVAHVFVALCDNENQGIVPVPRALGDGQRPAANLYWGARYGVRTYLTRDAGWTLVPHTGPRPEGVMERIVLKSAMTRGSSDATAYIVADAWDGSRIRDTLKAFLEAAAGRGRERIVVDLAELPIGGSGNLIVFLGHNGLMDFEAPPFRPGVPATPERPVMVLACASKPYFVTPLLRARARPVLVTTGLMAPEAYVLDAAVRTWFLTQNANLVRAEAASAYARFQKCGLRAARRLFEATE